MITCKTSITALSTRSSLSLALASSLMAVCCMAFTSGSHTSNQTPTLPASSVSASASSSSVTAASLSTTTTSRPASVLIGASTNAPSRSSSSTTSSRANSNLDSPPILLLASGQQQQQHQNRRSISDLTPPKHPEGAVGPADDSSIDSNYKFDGKDPFGDESLWQLPLQLVRDLTSSGSLAGAGAGAGASNDNNNNYNDDELRASHSLSSPKHSSGANIDLADDDDERFSDEIPSTGPGRYANSQPEVGVSAAAADASVPAASSGDLKTAAGYHYPHAEHAGYHGDHHGGHYGGHHHAASGPHGHHYGKYYQYVNVPYPYAYEFGYRRGNPYHTIERHEHLKGPHFKTKVKWSDKYGGYGVHVWDYNHDDNHYHSYGKHGGHGHHDSYGGHHDGYGYGAAGAASSPRAVSSTVTGAATAAAGAGASGYLYPAGR